MILDIEGLVLTEWGCATESVDHTIIDMLNQCKNPIYSFPPENISNLRNESRTTTNRQSIENYLMSSRMKFMVDSWTLFSDLWWCCQLGQWSWLVHEKPLTSLPFEISNHHHHHCDDQIHPINIIDNFLDSQKFSEIHCDEHPRIDSCNNHFIIVKIR